MNVLRQGTTYGWTTRIKACINYKDDQWRSEKLFPKSADAKKLMELMKIVKSAKSRNTKINSIVSNAEKYAGVILKLLEKFT